MNRGSNTPLVPAFEDPESALRKNKDKAVEDTNPPKESPFKDLKSVFGKKKSKKVEILKKARANFEQQDEESLYEAWERYKGLLRNCPHHDLNSQQEVSIFYDGMNVTTRQLLDSQGPLTKKPPPVLKELIEELSKHSREYHNLRNDSTRGMVNAISDEMATMMKKLESMDRRMTMMDQSIHAIRVGFENCRGSHLTKDCDLEENGNQKVQAYYSSGGRYDDDWRKPKKEWLPCDEYKKANRKSISKKQGVFYQKEELVHEKKSDFEDMLTRFAVASEKRHNDTDAAIKEQQNLMKENQIMMKDHATLHRNQQASILNIEKQLGQLAQQIKERRLGGLPSNTENNPKSAHINIMTTRSGKIITPLAPI
ncbi:uncharacterized protein LOC111916464 [Lactuca sativa]|uniref:uncharacterized protein LOC111916464 n=1 Tax=Lactuca sativa TaxID=4236 RepID=UPI000CD99496|nr:uncharacterized protein LOC111916464 [Lactuca sativa]